MARVKDNPYLTLALARCHGGTSKAKIDQMAYDLGMHIMSENARAAGHPLDTMVREEEDRWHANMQKYNQRPVSVDEEKIARSAEAAGQELRARRSGPWYPRDTDERGGPGGEG